MATTTTKPLNDLERAPKRRGFFRSRSTLFRRKSNLNLQDDARRDSALGSQESTSQKSSLPEEYASGTNTNPTPSIPIILIHDELNTPEISRPVIAHQDEPLNTPSPTTDLDGPSFRGITMNIPTGELDDPFSSDTMRFSNRGSVLAGYGTMHAVRRPVSQASRIEAVAESHIEDQLDGISAEDRRLSQKVRLMYESGVDDMSANLEHSVLGNGQSFCRTSGNLELARELPRHLEDVPSPNLRTLAANGHQSHEKEPVEPAGGFEDWRDIDAGEVDRYGFIQKTSRNSVSPNPQAGPLRRPLSTLLVSRNRPSPSDVDGNRLPANAAQGVTVTSANSQRISVMSGSGGVRSTSALSALSFRSDEGRRRKTIKHANDMLGPPSSLQSEEVHTDATRSAVERRREAKWAKMAKPLNTSTGAHGGGTIFTFDTSSSKVVSRTWKGIPDRWRASAWHSFLLASARRQFGPKFPTDAQLTARFAQLQMVDCADDAQIDTDVPRTIGSHIMFRKRYCGGQRLLFRVLRALALHFPETGYVQGMAPLVATLLCYYDEEQAFVMAARLWQLRGLTVLYSPGFGGLMAALEVFETKWLGASDAKLAKHFEALGIMPMAYGTKWYLTLFNYSVPFAAQLRIWDVFMLLGSGGSGGGTSNAEGQHEPDLDVLHATSMALLDGMRDELLKGEFEEAMGLVTAGVPIGAGREDVLMGVVRTEWEAGRRRRGLKG